MGRPKGQKKKPFNIRLFKGWHRFIDRLSHPGYSKSTIVEEALEHKYGPVDERGFKKGETE